MTRWDWDVWIVAMHRPVVYRGGRASRDRPRMAEDVDIVSQAEWIDFLSERSGRRETVAVPQRGEFLWRESVAYISWVPPADTDDCRREDADGYVGCDTSCWFWEKGE